MIATYYICLLLNLILDYRPFMNISQLWCCQKRKREASKHMEHQIQIVSDCYSTGTMKPTSPTQQRVVAASCQLIREEEVGDQIVTVWWNLQLIQFSWFRYMKTSSSSRGGEKLREGGGWRGCWSEITEGGNDPAWWLWWCCWWWWYHPYCTWKLFSEA